LLHDILETGTTIANPMRMESSYWELEKLSLLSFPRRRESRRRPRNNGEPWTNTWFMLSQ